MLKRRTLLAGGVSLAVACASEANPSGDAGGARAGGSDGVGGDGGGTGGAGAGSGGAGGGNPSTPTLQLPEGHYTPAKLPPNIVAPRPNDELGPDSTYRWAHEGVRYEVPIGVVGGAWPFTFEVVEGPEGMEVGTDLLAVDDRYERYDNYGVVTWTPPPGSDGQSFSYTMRVTDQEGTAAEVSVEVLVQNAKFVFVAPDDGTASGDGSIDAPLRGFDALYEGSSTIATYAGRLVYFRAGSYTLTGGGDANGNARLTTAKPKVWRAFPDEVPVFDCRTAKVFFANGGMDDCCFAGIRWEHGRQDVNNAHFVWAAGRFDRGLFWRNTFFDLERGQVGNDNPAAIFLSSAANYRRHIVVLSNVFDTLGAGGGNGVAAYDSYGLDESLFENNVAQRCASSHCFWLKGGHQRTTVRGERGTEGNAIGTALLVVSLGRDGGTDPSFQVEVSYCAMTTASGDAMRLVYNTSGGETDPLWVFRCSVNGDVAALNTDSAVCFLEHCVFTEPADGWPDGATFAYDEVVQIDGSDLGASLALMGAARSTYLGTHGFEVA